MTRLRAGEWLAGLGAVGLLVVLFLNWFSSGDLEKSGWGSLGWLLDVALAVVALGGLSITYMTLKRTSPAWPVGASALTLLAGTIVTVVLLIRVITQPDLGAGLPDALVSVELAAYLGVAFCALIPIGAAIALHDERLDAPESAYTPPPPRPVPGT